MRKILLVLSLYSLSVQVSSQTINKPDRSFLAQKEDSLRVWADSMINAEDPGKRFRSDSNFIKTLVRALKTNNSFYYPFDSVETISRLYAPDSSFRIFTWQLKKDAYIYLQRGAIQMRTKDGTLKLYPLFDASMFTGKPQDSVRNRNNWIGAIYYKIIEKTFNNQKYYTLLGFDDYSIGSNRKWMEILTLDKGEPLFGGPYISFKQDTGKMRTATVDRFYIEYKKEARTTFNYNAELDMIIYDHLISEDDQPDRKETYIPDGDFEGFKWKNGQWVHVEKVFNFSLKDGEAPLERPIRNTEGKPDEQKLQEQSDKNKKLKKN